MIIQHIIDKKTTEDHQFSELYSCPNGHGSMPELDPKLFSFNTPLGACPKCSGIGVERSFAPELIVPNPDLSLKKGAIAPWAKTNNVYYVALLEGLSSLLGFSMTKPFSELPEKVQKIILYGLEDEYITIDTSKYPSLGYADYQTHYEGVIPQLERRYRDSNSESWKSDMENFMIERPCPECHGSRLRPEARAVKVKGKNIKDLCDLSIEKLFEFFIELKDKLSNTELKIADKLLTEIQARLRFLVDVGLEYLSLSRTAKTLSGGEAQRIRLASQIGSGLSGVLYVLDEPSIGLASKR